MFGDQVATDPGMVNKRSVVSEQNFGAMLEQQQRQGDSMDRIANAMELMVTTSMTITLVYPWKADPSVVRAVLLRSDHDRERLRLSMIRYENSNRDVPVEDWLEKERFFVVKNESIFLDREGVGMFMPHAAHRELIPPGEMDPSRVLRLQRDIEAEEAESREREARRLLPKWSARASADR